MWDAAYPPAADPGFPVAAGYAVGGHDATHVWSADEWARVRAMGSVQYLLAIFVASDYTRGMAGHDDANALCSWARANGQPTDTAVALDVEQYAAQGAHDSGYANEWAATVRAAGYVPLLYTSASSGHLFAGMCELWLAQWNGTPHLIDGTAATQYAAPGAGTSLAVDLSVVRDGFALWPAHDHGGPPPMPNAKIVDIVTHPGDGYTCLGADGGVFVYNDPGNKYFHGSMGGQHLVAPCRAITYTADGGGYWIVAEDGGVFAFGNAKYAGHPYDGK